MIPVSAAQPRVHFWHPASTASTLGPFLPRCLLGVGVACASSSGVMAARAGLPPGTCSACPPLAFPAWGLDAGQEARANASARIVSHWSPCQAWLLGRLWRGWQSNHAGPCSFLRSCGWPGVKGRVQAKTGAISLPHLDVYSRLLFFDLICPGVRGRARAKASATSPSRLGRALLCVVLHTLRCGKVDTG